MRRLSWLLFVGLLLGLTPSVSLDRGPQVVAQAQAEDSSDIRGTRWGCKDVTATGSWVGFTSADVENGSGSSALDSGLYWTEGSIKSGSGAVYVCTAPAASCGADTTNKLAAATGAALTIPLRGVDVLTVSLRATNGVTVQLCGYFRSGR